MQTHLDVRTLVNIPALRLDAIENGKRVLNTVPDVCGIDRRHTAAVSGQ